MASSHPHRRRTKLVTPANSSFSNCVQGHLFTQPIRNPLDDFKPLVYLDEQGRKHGRVSDHLLQRQIESDRQKMKTKPMRRDPPSSTLYGIRNPNIAALVKGVELGKMDEEDEDEDEKAQADEEIKFIEYKKPEKGGTSKIGNRQISSISGKQSVKFDTTPSVNMARLVDSHLTELDDIDDVDDEDGDELESIQPIRKVDRDDRDDDDKTPFTLSDTPATPKDMEGGMTTNSTLDYARQSEDFDQPPRIDDQPQTPSNGLSEEDLSSREDTIHPGTVPTQQQQQQPRILSSQTGQFYERPKTASSSARSRSYAKSSTTTRTTSSGSTDNTSSLLRTDGDDDDDDDDDDDETSVDQRIRMQTPIRSNRTSTKTMSSTSSEPSPVVPIVDSPTQGVKGEYNSDQVIQLKESFQPIINEAASYGHLDIVRKLIESGQSVHTQNLLQRTPLHEACLSGNGDLVAELLQNGALIDQQDSQGMTPLHLAASHGSLKCLRILCEKGCNVNIQDNLGHTAAHYSAMHNHVETLKYLIEKQHIDLNRRNNESKLAVHYAAKYGSTHVLKYFLQMKLHIFMTDKYGNTIAHEACERNQLECVKLMSKMQRNLFETTNLIQRTPLHTAAVSGSSEVLHWLLELQIIPIDQVDKDGYTLAHLAASRGHGECFSCLILHGASFDVYTFDRRESVFDLAKRSGKNSRIEQAQAGTLQCPSCQNKYAKEMYDHNHARNAVEQLIHTQIQRGYHLNLPTNRSSTQISQRNRSTLA